MVEGLKAYIRFCEIQYGVKIPIDDWVGPAKTQRLSDHLQPFLYSKKSPIKARAIGDLDLTAIVQRHGLSVDSFAMAFPNLEAIYQDLFKYSYSDVPDLQQPELEDHAVDVVVEMLQKSFPEPFSPEPFNEAVQYLNRDTSAGYPENIKYKNKAAWLDDESIDHEMIAQRYAQTGVCIGQCSFKEEIRPLEKLEQDKARSFLAGNIAENLCWLVYCGPLFRAFAAAWRDLPITYGLSEFHRGWHYLILRLREWWGKKTDMKQCDGSLDYKMQRLVGKVLKFFIRDVSPGNGWPKAHEAIDRMIKANCQMWVRLSSGVLFLKKQGNGSGGGATIQINSLSQLIAVIIYLLHRGLSKETIQKYFEFQCHGDDGRFAAHPDYVHYLNVDDINAWWQSQGRAYRFEAESAEPQDLAKATWLSRLSRWFENTWVPYPKEPEKLLASAVLRNRVPDHIHPRAYIMSRWWQLTNQMVFVPQSSAINFDSMSAIGSEYQILCESSDPTLVSNRQWRAALASRKSRRWLQLQHISSVKKPMIHQYNWELQGKPAATPNIRQPLWKKLFVVLALASSVVGTPSFEVSSSAITTHGDFLISAVPCEKHTKMVKNAKKSQTKMVKKVVAAARKIKKVARKVGTKKNVIRGKGDFFSDIWKKGKTLLGQGLHKGIDFLSDRAKNLVGHLVGSGDYHMSGESIKSNSLYSGAAMVPTFQNSAQHGNIVCHRESLGLINSQTQFTRTSYTLNPGLAVFPWLSRIAPAWQRYKVHGAIIEWIPRVPEISTNAGGSVVLSTRYDLTTAAPSSIIEAEVGFGAITARPMDKMAMPIECKNSMNPTNVLNVRFGSNLPAGANAQFFDHCIIDVCVTGQASAGALIGEVFITYDIEFMMPTAETISNASVTSAVLYNSITTANPYGVTSGWVVRPGSALSFQLLSSVGGCTIGFDPAFPLPIGSTWMVSVVTAATGVITVNSTPGLGTDLQYYSVFKNNAGADGTNFPSSPGGGQELVNFAFKVINFTNGQAFVLNNLTLAAASTGYMTISITPIVSTITMGDMQMRHRFPKLYETEDMLAEMRELRGRVQDDEKKFVAAKGDLYARVWAEANTHQESISPEEKCETDEECDDDDCPNGCIGCIHCATPDEWKVINKYLERSRARKGGSVLPTPELELAQVKDTESTDSHVLIHRNKL